MDGIIFSLILLFLFAVLNYKRKQTWKAPSFFVMGIYLVSLAFAIIHVMVNKEILINDHSYFFASLFVLFGWCLYLLPFYSFKETSVNEFVFPNLKTLNAISTVLIVASIWAIIYYTTSVVSVFAYGDLGEARRGMVAGEVSFIETGFFHTLAGVVSSMYSISLLLAFAYMAIGGHKKRVILLFVSSFSYVLNVLSNVGRDGAVFWAMSAVFCYLLFNSFIKKDAKKSFRLFAIAAVSLLAVPFMQISFGRFEDETNSYFISYLGQPFVNASFLIGADNIPFQEGRSFPYFLKLLGLEEPQNIYWEVPGTNSTEFTSFLGSFCVSLGVWGFIIMGILSFIFFKFTVCKKGPNRFYFHSTLIYLMYFQVMSQGVFYFRQGNRGGNIFIILMLLFYLILKDSPVYNNAIRIKQEQ